MQAERKPDWTPGPWEAIDARWPGVWAKDRDQTVIIASSDSDATVETGVGGYTAEERAANARLIAAAPDMYEALRMASAYMADSDKHWLSVINAAIAKAEGR